MKLKIIIIRGEADNHSTCYNEMVKKFMMHDIFYIDVDKDMEKAFSLGVKHAALDSKSNKDVHYLIMRDSTQTYCTRRSILNYVKKLIVLNYDIAMLCRWGSKIDGDIKIEGNIYGHHSVTSTQALLFSPRMIKQFEKCENFLEEVNALICSEKNFNIYSISPNIFNFETSLSSTKEDLYRNNIYWESAIKKDKSITIVKFVLIVMVILFTAWAVYHVRNKKYVKQSKG